MNRAKPMVPRTGSQRRSDGDTVRIPQKLVPKLPHERDESAAIEKEPPAPVMEKAADDLKQGRQDTGRSPQTNRLARRLASKD